MILILCQVYPPDTPAVGQYVAEIAEALAAEGNRVRVLTSARGYENPRQRFAAQEWRRGVEVWRLPWSSLGKRTLWHRLGGQLLFCAQALWHGLWAPRGTRVVVSTSPPMVPMVALLLRRLRGFSFAFWAMDVNPDQAIALGHLRPGHPLARALSWVLAHTIRRATPTVALDEGMAQRLRAKTSRPGPVVAIPLWPLEGVASGDWGPAIAAWRAQHGWRPGDRLLMYSGNHSVAHPLDTVADALRQVLAKGHTQLPWRWAFVGEGLAKAPLEAIAAAHPNGPVACLPYQPLAQLGASLGAADIHLVVLGPAMDGIVHPCKIYTVMALGKPVLLVAPAHSHHAQLVREFDCGWQVEHGDVAGLLQLWEQLATLSPAALAERGARARAAAEAHFSRPTLLPRVVAELGKGAAASSG